MTGYKKTQEIVDDLFLKRHKLANQIKSTLSVVEEHFNNIQIMQSSLDGMTTQTEMWHQMKGLEERAKQCMSLLRELETLNVLATGESYIPKEY